MATMHSVWGIDIGQCALKALKLQEVNGEFQVDAFDIIEHPKILSQPDADRSQLIHNALEQFLARNSVVGSTVVVSVPGQSSFTRFVKLPPVESKRIPDIVRFEAEQQIPFSIDEVIWRYQTFRDADSPDVEVGIFAMKRADVAEMLDHFVEVSMNVDIVQMAPLALYNFMCFDNQVAEDGATLLMDVGADKTDLVVADGPRIWTRTIQIGGNNFTEALVRAFKLSFTKAEKLKRTAASSKYARQIFQAMRPVFADLVQEVQRSIGYYTSLHREARFRRVVGLGNGFRLPGLQKFLEQNLNVSVVRVDSYSRLTPSVSVSAPTFTENTPAFAVAYGLALQGLEQTAISTNLLPSTITRHRLWQKKRPWFVAAAAATLLIVAGMSFGNYRDGRVLSEMKKKSYPAVKDTISQTDGGVKELGRYDNQGKKEKKQANDRLKFEGYRDYWPSVMAIISESIQNVTGKEQRLMQAYAAASGEDGESARKQEELVKNLKGTNRSERRMIVLRSMETPRYVSDVYNIEEVYSAEARGPAVRGSRDEERTPSRKRSKKPKPGFRITLVVRTPLPQANAMAMLGWFHQNLQSVSRRHPSVSVISRKDIDPLKLEGVAAGADRGGAMPGPGGPGGMPGAFGPGGPGGMPGAFGPGGPGGMPGAFGPGEGRALPKDIANRDPFTGEDMSGDTLFRFTFWVAIDGDGITLPTEDKDKRGR